MVQHFSLNSSQHSEHRIVPRFGPGWMLKNKQAIRNHKKPRPPQPSPWMPSLSSPQPASPIPPIRSMGSLALPSRLLRGVVLSGVVFAFAGNFGISRLEHWDSCFQVDLYQDQNYKHHRSCPEYTSTVSTLSKTQMACLIHLLVKSLHALRLFESRVSPETVQSHEK